jgi:hypothetical protein
MAGPGGQRFDRLTCTPGFEADGRNELYRNMMLKKPN